MITARKETMPAEPISFIDVNVHPITLQVPSSSTEDIDHSFGVLAECDIPLSDPLALDDNSMSGAELIDLGNITSADSDTPTDGQIILIDLTKEGVPSDGSDFGSASDGYIAEDRPQISEIISRRSCLKIRSPESVSMNNPKRVKRNVKFDGINNIFYFERLQGNSCVPSQGGCTLGMERYHMHHRTFSLAEHADDTNTKDESIENSGHGLDTKPNRFLRPVPSTQRKAMLKTAGVLKIDANETDECRLIRTSRKVFGCNCRIDCDPDTCECSQSGIQCQVDESDSPCGCTRRGCVNVFGRVEFDPERVRIHFIDTMLRLEQNKQNSSEEIFFKKDVSRQWHPQTHISTTISISDFPHCNNYNPGVFDNLSHRTTSTACCSDGSFKDCDRIAES